MLQPALMHELSVILYNDKNIRSKVIEELHKAGITEIVFLSDKDIKDINEKFSKISLNLTRLPPQEELDEISSKLADIYRIYGLLKHETKKQTFLEQMLGVEKIEKIDVERQNFTEVIKRADDLLNKTKNVFEISSNIDKLKTKISETKKIISELELLPDNLLLDIFGAGKKYNIFAINFTVKKDKEKDEIERKIKAELENKGIYKIYEVHPSNLGKKEKSYTAIIAVENTEKEIIEKISKFGRFIQPSLNGIVKDKINELKEKIENYESGINEFKKNLKEIFDANWKEILVCKELLEIEKERATIVVNGCKTKKTVYFKIFVPAEKSKDIQNLIEKNSNGLCEIKVNEDPEDAPTLMKNPYPINKYEFLTAIYGLPKYKHLDPSLLVVPFIILFVGMMIADAAYGIILLGISLLLIKKYGKYSKEMKDFFQLVMLTAIVAIIVGVLNGDYFGNLLHNYYATSILGLTDPAEIEKVSLPGQIFHPEGHDLMFYLQLAVCMGAIHMWIGVLLGLYDAIRRRKYLVERKVKMTIEEYSKKLKKLNGEILNFISWAMFGLGMIIAFFGFIANAFGFPFHPFDSETFMYISLGLMVVGVLVAMKHNPVLTPIETIDYFAFILSYARIMALLVAAGAVASAFNTLAGSIWGVAFGLIAILIFLAGQTLHFLLGVLSAFVQALRLTYVEHFSRYYEGGGRMFNKFEEKRKWTKVIE